MSGAQLNWFTSKPSLFKRESLLGVDPSFTGKNVQKVKYAKLIPNKKYPCEPSLSVYVYDNENNEYPLIMDMYNYLEKRDIDFSKVSKVTVTLFAKVFESFEDKSIFWKKYPRGEKISIPAPGMFIPTGTFSPVNDPAFIPHAECWCYGEVISFSKLINNISGGEYYHFVMKTLAASYDLVVDTKLVKGDPRKFEIIGGTFWVSSKIMDYS